MATAIITSATPAPIPGLDVVPPAPPGGDILYEVVNNRIRELPPIGARETHIASLLFGALFQYARDHGLGQAESEMLFLLILEQNLQRRPDVANLQRRPDVAFVSFERWPRHKPVPDTNAWEVVPDLAVEVVSPAKGAYEIIEKLEDYSAAGVRRVWVIDPSSGKLYDYDSTTSVRILTRADTSRGGEVLPGFELPLAELFGEPAGPA